MYTVVLMTAITAGSASPDNWFGGRRACSGYYACSGYACNGCLGCNSCSGCAGCWGPQHADGGVYGSYGYMSVHGNFCTGGWGGGCGGWGTYSGYPAWNGYGCGCYGGSPGYGYYGTGWYNPFGCFGCYGAYGGHSGYGIPLPHHGYYQDSPGSPTDRTPKTEVTPLPKKVETKEKTSLENRARVIVQLPADAKLFIDGRLMKSASETRTFQTPDLRAGETYFYDLRAEVEREGQVVSETQRVTLRPGQVVTANFGSMDAATASRAK